MSIGRGGVFDLGRHAQLRRGLQSLVLDTKRHGRFDWHRLRWQL
jgi:hypothetical protein